MTDTSVDRTAADDRQKADRLRAIKERLRSLGKKGLNDLFAAGEIASGRSLSVTAAKAIVRNTVPSAPPSGKRELMVRAARELSKRFAREVDFAASGYGAGNVWTSRRGLVRCIRSPSP